LIVLRNVCLQRQPGKTFQQWLAKVKEGRFEELTGMIYMGILDHPNSINTVMVKSQA
jgi:hypothetical protein